jgi:hypothetical protein
MKHPYRANGNAAAAGLMLSVLLLAVIAITGACQSAAPTSVSPPTGIRGEAFVNLRTDVGDRAVKVPIHGSVKVFDASGQEVGEVQTSKGGSFEIAVGTGQYSVTVTQPQTGRTTREAVTVPETGYASVTLSLNECACG